MKEPTWTFAAWVTPVADQMRESRYRVIEFVRTTPDEFWECLSKVPGWTHKDILAHLAGGNDQMLQAILRSVVAKQPIDRAALDPDTDGENARGVAERRSWSIERLIEVLESDGEEMQDLLSKLTEKDEALRYDGKITLGQLMRVVLHENHDNEHLEQLYATVQR